SPQSLFLSSFQLDKLFGEYLWYCFSLVGMVITGFLSLFFSFIALSFFSLWVSLFGFSLFHYLHYTFLPFFWFGGLSLPLVCLLLASLVRMVYSCGYAYYFLSFLGFSC